ncbi:hypothetical protein CR513_33064, partial [Mucuna pruriens]
MGPTIAETRGTPRPIDIEKSSETCGNSSWKRFQVRTFGAIYREQKNVEEIETLRRENDTRNMITRQKAEAEDAKNQDAHSQGETNMLSKIERSH